ncbi:hypothetical protein T03_14973 [Trichinella britovi]|uniref:Uncharacterized protein n=1 Tax=Trichinella britovi TaxID=45882 RepID=A0A0V0Z3Z3_TRIBR|nr:hypothetical protein T03_14973 [Trichinella britovi]
MAANRLLHHHLCYSCHADCLPKGVPNLVRSLVLRRVNAIKMLKNSKFHAAFNRSSKIRLVLSAKEAESKSDEI